MSGWGQAIGMIAGSALGAMNDNANRKHQLGMQTRGINESVWASKALTDYQRQQQMKLWEDTNYSAQMKQMKKAGLNVGLMYNGSGQGGSTQLSSGGTPSGGSGAGSNNMTQGMAIGSQAGAQLELLKAQKENIEADTANKQADATKKAGTDTEESQTRIASMMQNIQNEKIKNEILGYEASMKKADEILYNNEDVAGGRFISAMAEVEKKSAEAISALIKAQVDQSTKDEMISLIQQEVISVELEQAFKKAQVNKTNAEIDKMAQDIVKMKNDMIIQGKQVDLQETKMWIDGAIGGINAVSNILNVSKIADLLSKGTETSTRTVQDGENGRTERHTTTTTRRRR